MRLKQYLTEETKPTTKKYKFFVDNPGGGWLENEKAKAAKSHWAGSLTAGFHERFLVPTKMVQNLRGVSGENRKLSEPRVQDLMTSIKEHGIYDPIFITVQYDGEPKISEGNRRALIAKTMGIKYVPVELRYFAGGEREEGPWHPDKIVKVAKKWIKPKRPIS